MPLKEIFHLDKKERKLALWLGITDNIAWVAYAFSSTFIPIAVAAGISESYIIIALMLGLIFNKEKLKKHQWLGLILALISVVVLAVVTDK
jgi:drug/metabolite transporter (DMT)-like permease